MVIDRLENWRLHAADPKLAKAFALLDAETMALPEGRHELVPGVIAAIVQTSKTKEPSEGRLEAHRRFIDIQLVLDGEEAIGWAPVETLSEDGAFDPDADIGVYRGHWDLVTVRKGWFAVFHPHDAHAPGLQREGAPTRVRKLVLKVAV